MRNLVALTTLPLLVGALQAQCLDTTGGTPAVLVSVTGDPIHDEGLSAPIDMMLGAGGFPMAGAVGGPFTHAAIDSNGVLYLTSGGAPVGRVDYGATLLADLRGAAGDAPRVFPLWSDLEGPATTWAVTVDTSVAGRFKVNWIDVEAWLSGGPSVSFSASLFDTGAIEFAYGDLSNVLFGDPLFAGVSIGGGVGTGAEVGSDLTALPDSGTLGLLFAEFLGAPTSLSGLGVSFFPNGTGGYTAVVTCTPPLQASYGSGCYGDSFYDLYEDAAEASTALTGNALAVVPTATGYNATWISGGAVLYVPPVGATDLPRTDDLEQALDLTVILGAGAALPTPSGPVSTLYVHSNGFVSLAPGNDTGAWNTPANIYTPTAEFRNAPSTAFWAWHDWNPADVAGGPIRWHHDAGSNVLYLTWDGVESYSEPIAANPGTFQFQFDLNTGAVTYVWVAVDADTTSIFGSAHLVGYSPGGASADPGELPFALAGGTTTIDGFAALRLDASPLPAILPGGSSNPIDYTISNLPDYAPPAGVRLGILAFSVAPAPSIDLGFLGAPGCQANIASLDIQFSIAVIGSATQTVTLTFPPPLSPGLSFYSQAIALIPPGSYPGGLNSFGLLTSNGIETRF